MLVSALRLLAEDAVILQIKMTATLSRVHGDAHREATILQVKVKHPHKV